MFRRNPPRTRGRDGTRPRGGRTPLQILLAAPGADAFFDADWLAGLTKDGSDKVSAMLSRIGSHTVEQATAGNQPTWGATSPSGKRGITFTGGSGHRLVDPLTTLGALYTGTQAYSALWVARFSAPGTGTQSVWSIGASGSTTHVFHEGCENTTAADQRIRFTAAAVNTSNTGTAHTTTIVCATTLFTGSAYSSWLNGTASISAAANTRSSTVDQLAIGTRRISGAFGSNFTGEFYGLIISRTQWTTAQRQALEQAAKQYWGSP